MSRLSYRLDQEDSKYIYLKNKFWHVDITLLREKFPDIKWPKWLSQDTIKPHYEYFVERGRHFRNDSGIPSESEETSIRFTISMDEVQNSMPKRIFLSHKSENKPLVREFFKTLRLIGLDPWLDEEDMSAGTKLERALLKGMQDSCAAVFFITSAYKDERFLETEIDYAIREKREKGDKFSIIVLEMEDENGDRGVVPGLLRDYVWKSIGHGEDLKVLREILKALPFEAKINI